MVHRHYGLDNSIQTRLRTKARAEFKLGLHIELFSELQLYYNVDCPYAGNYLWYSSWPLSCRKSSEDCTRIKALLKPVPKWVKLNPITSNLLDFPRLGISNDVFQIKKLSGMYHCMC